MATESKETKQERVTICVKIGKPTQEQLVKNAPKERE